MAQLGARFHGMEEVVGSIPTRSTKSLNGLASIAILIPKFLPVMLACSWYKHPKDVFGPDRLPNLSTSALRRDRVDPLVVSP